MTQIEALVLRGKILLLKNEIGAAKELFRLVEKRAKKFGFVKITDELQIISLNKKKSVKHTTISKGVIKIRQEISELLTPEEIHTSILESILNLNIPWPSKQKILFTCVKDLHLISSTVTRWKDQKLISESDYDYLNELMAEKRTI